MTVLATAAGTATQAAQGAPSVLTNALQQGASAIGALPSDVSQWPLLLQK